MRMSWRTAYEALIQESLTTKSLQISKVKLGVGEQIDDWS